VEEVEKLKQEAGDDLTVGGANFAATLLAAGLIDEIRAIVHPVIIGAGTPFLPPVDNTINLRLLETETFASGVVFLRYEVTK
jgi:dihydrofolate reductase